MPQPRKRITVKCAVCGDELERTPSRTTYQAVCNKICKAQLLRQLHSRKVIVNCATCGDKLERQASDVQENSRHFCTRKCRAAFDSMHKEESSPLWRREEVACTGCGTVLKRTPYQIAHRANHFCTEGCQAEWQVGRFTGSNSPSFKSTQVNCAHCGKKLLRAPWQLKRNMIHYCNQECRDAHRPIRLAKKNADKHVKIPCSWCGTILNRLKRDVVRHNNAFCSRECTGRWRTVYLCGEQNPRWQGGYSDYHGPDWEQQRNRARVRDDYKCQACGTPEEELDRQLDVHHLIPFMSFGYIPGENENNVQANQIENLACLCMYCHRKVELGIIAIQLRLCC